MSRSPLRFKQTDVERAMRAADKAGARVTVDILPDGTIRLTPVDRIAGPESGWSLDPNRVIPL